MLVLAGVSFFGGTSVLAHQLTEVALDTLAVAAIGLVGREVVGDRVGVIAALLAAVYPRLWATEGEALSETHAEREKRDEEEPPRPSPAGQPCGPCSSRR